MTPHGQDSEQKQGKAFIAALVPLLFEKQCIILKKVLSIPAHHPGCPANI